MKKDRFYRWSNNKGDVSGITFIIVLFAAIMFVSYLVGFIRIAHQRQTLARSAWYISRTIGRQGGISNTKPAEWEGTKSIGYITANSMMNTVRTMFNSSGITDFDIDINGQALTSNSTFTFKEEIVVTITMRYDWNMLGGIIGGASGKKSYTVVRKAKSESWIRHEKVVQYGGS